jgi:hypothetical protein
MFRFNSLLIITGNKDYWDNYPAKFILKDILEIHSITCLKEYFIITNSRNHLTIFYALIYKIFMFINNRNRIIYT